MMFLLLHSQVQVGIAGSRDWTKRELELSKEDTSEKDSKKSSASETQEKTETSFTGEAFATFIGDFNSWLIGVQIYAGKAFNNKSDFFEKDWYGGAKCLLGKSFSQRFHLYLGAGVETAKLKDLKFKFKKKNDATPTNENTFSAFVAGINADLFLTHSLGLGVEASIRFPRSYTMTEIKEEIKANYRSTRITGKLIWIIL